MGQFKDKPFRGYIQMGKAGEYIVKATKPFPLYLWRKLIRNPVDSPADKYAWAQGINRLRTDDNFAEWYGTHGMGYLAALFSTCRCFRSEGKL